MTEEEKQTLFFLQECYTFNKFWYSLSFRERLSMKLFNEKYTIGKPSKETQKLSLEELQQKMDELKAPWWNKIAEFFGI